VTPLVQPFAALPLVRRISFAEPYPFGLKDERLRDGTAQAQGAVIVGALDRLPFGAMWEMHDLCEHVDRIGRGVSQPTLIVHARDDDMSDPRNAYRLQRALGADLTAEFFGAPAAAPAAARPERRREPADA